MSLDAPNLLSARLAAVKRTKNALKQNLSPDDDNAQLQVQTTERVVADGTLGLEAKQYNYDSTSFVLDHITLGNLDSSILLIDGGYSNPSGTVLFNINI